MRTAIASTDVVRADLSDILERTRDLWEGLRGARILVTGGTGFVGAWLLAALVDADERLGLGVRAVVTSRDPGLFRARQPHLGAGPVELVAADVRLPLPVAGSFDAVICAAAPASAAINTDSPREMFETIVSGTANTLDAAAPAGAVPFLLVSSGAVYGPQPPGVTHLAEDHLGGPDPLSPTSAYAEGKRAAETLCATVGVDGPRVTVARCFSFVGPTLPVDRHFAIGNFLADAAARRPIEVGGGGTTVRSWMYTSDLTVWLWTILLRGTAGRPYNVGSEDATSIANAARTLASLTPTPSPVVIRGDPAADRGAPYYVPSTRRAEEELDLHHIVPLSAALERTLDWLQSGGHPLLGGHP